MLDRGYLESIKGFEGFAQRAKWDYAQHTNGFGTRALFQGEIVTPAEAHRRFASEIKAAAEIVDRFAPNLGEGTRAALTSLTFNAGAAWTKSGLGKAVASGDLETARELFLQYNKAGGEVLPGLIARRCAEATWFDTRPADSHIATLSNAIGRPMAAMPNPSLNNSPVVAVIDDTLVCDAPQPNAAIFQSGDSAPGAFSFSDLPLAIFDLLATFIHDQSQTRSNANESDRESSVT